MYPQIFQILPYVYREMQTSRVIFLYIYGVVLLFCGFESKEKNPPFKRENTKTKMIIVLLFTLEDGFLSFKPFSCA